MEGLSITMRVVCLSVVAVSLAVGSVPGAFGQALPPPAAPRVSNNSTNGGIDVTIPPKRTTETQYTITVRDDKANSVGKKTMPAYTQQMTFNITDIIQANRAYSVTLQAQNSTSTSAESPAATILTFPAPPTNITGVGGLQKVTVSWTATDGAASYQLTLSNGMSFTTTATSYVVTGLQTATSYNVIVASINAAGGRGPFSPAVVVRTANVALQ